MSRGSFMINMAPKFEIITPWKHFKEERMIIEIRYFEDHYLVVYILGAIF